MDSKKRPQSILTSSSIIHDFTVKMNNQRFADYYAVPIRMMVHRSLRTLVRDGWEAGGYDSAAAELEQIVWDQLCTMREKGKLWYRKELGQFRSLLKTICSNQARTLIRNEHCRVRYVRADSDALLQNQHNLPEPESDNVFTRRLDQETIKADIRLVLDSLKDKKRHTIQSIKVVRYRLLRNKEPTEIARRLGMTLTAVHTAYSRVMQSLRDALCDLRSEYADRMHMFESERLGPVSSGDASKVTKNPKGGVC